MVESREIEVPFVRTADNISDFFTKPFSAGKFHAMRKAIMNVARSGAERTKSKRTSASE